MSAPQRNWLPSRSTMLAFVVPLVIVCAFSASTLLRGLSHLGMPALFSAVVIFTFYLIGTIGMRLSGWITSPDMRRLVNSTIVTIMALANWGMAAFALIGVPGMPHTNYEKSAEEFRSRAALEAFGAELCFNRHGQIILVSLRDVSGDALTALRDLKYLEYLILQNMKIDALTALRDLKHLHSLSLSDSKISEGAMADLAHIRSLEELCLDGTPVTDECVRRLSELSRLRSLTLSKSRITDIGLRGLSRLEGLEKLRLAGTNISDSGMAEVGKLRALQVLDLDGTAISGIGLRELRHLNHLSELYLEGTRVRDDDLTCVGSFKSLQQLSLSRTTVTDAGLMHLAALTELRHLNLTGTLITDAGLLRLLGLRRLKSLSVRGTRVTAAGLQTFTKTITGCAVDSNTQGHKTLSSETEDANDGPIPNRSVPE